MKRIGQGNSTAMPKEIRDREPRTIGQAKPAQEARDDRDKSETKEKGEGK